MSPRRPAAPGGARPAGSAIGPSGQVPPASSPARTAKGAQSPAKAPGGTKGRTVRPVARPGGSRGPRPGTAGRSAAGRAGIAAGSGRPVWVIGAVGVLLVALILPYFQKWLVQRSQIEAARASVAQSQQGVKTLNEQLKQWQDDQYVKTQARQRLHYVMPGETGYVVVAQKQRPAQQAVSQKTASVPTGNRPWYSDIWLSAQAAGASASP